MENKQKQSLLVDVDLEQLMNQYSLEQLQLKDLPYKQTSRLFRLLQGIIITDDNWNLLKLKQIKSVMFTATLINQPDKTDSHSHFTQFPHSHQRSSQPLLPFDKSLLHILMVAVKSFPNLFLKSHFFHLLHLKTGEEMIIDASEVSVPLSQQITQAFSQKEVKLVEEFLDALSAMIDSKNGNSILIPSDLFSELVLTEDMKIKLDWHFFLKSRPQYQESDISSAHKKISDTRKIFKQKTSQNDCSAFLKRYYNDNIPLESYAQQLLYQTWLIQQSQNYQYEDAPKHILSTALKEYLLPLVSKQLELQEKIMRSNEPEELIRRYLFREQFCEHFIKNLSMVAVNIKSEFKPQSVQTIGDFNKSQSEVDSKRNTQNFRDRFPSQQMNFFVQENRETYQIYQKLIKVCKQSYYKLILKKAEQLFIQSPFYPQFFQEVRNAIENRSNTIKAEKLRQLNLLYLQQHNQFFPYYPQAAEEIQQQYQNLIQSQFNGSTGNIHEVEISLTESLRLSRLQKPVRFTSCRNHLSCLDQSAETIGISECPECKSPLSSFYNDEYLEFLCEIFQVNSIDDDNSSENAVQAVNINTQTGVFFPVLRGTIFEDMMPTIMDAEFLYSIANRTYKKLDSATDNDENDIENSPDDNHQKTTNISENAEQEYMVEEYEHAYQIKENPSDDEEKNLTPTVPFKDFQQHPKNISNDRANTNRQIQQYDPFEVSIGKEEPSHEVYDEFSDFYYDNYPDYEDHTNMIPSQPNTESQQPEKEHKTINKPYDKDDFDITETLNYYDKSVSNIPSSSKPAKNNQIDPSISSQAIFHSIYQIWKARGINAEELRFSKYFNNEELMSEPSRSIYCKHSDCFDLSDLIRHNSLAAFSANAIKCPVCSISFQIEHIVHDRQYSKLIAQYQPHQKNNLQNLNANIDLINQELTSDEKTIAIYPKHNNNSHLNHSFQEYLEGYQEEQQKDSSLKK